LDKGFLDLGAKKEKCSIIVSKEGLDLRSW